MATEKQNPRVSIGEHMPEIIEQLVIAAQGDEGYSVSTAWHNSARNRIHRYRERHPRIDYYPAADVLAILLHHSALTGEPCLAGVLDGLIRVAHRAVTGNGAK